jgi:hypothetical protein
VILSTLTQIGRAFARHFAITPLREESENPALALPAHDAVDSRMGPTSNAEFAELPNRAEPHPPSQPLPAASETRLQSQRAPEGPPLREIMLEALGLCRERVLKRIQRANRMTATEVLAVGESLGAIVDRAQAQVTDTRSALASMSGKSNDGVSELVERQMALISAHFEALRTALTAQTQLTQQALGVSSGIAAIGEQVAKVAFQTRLLSLNANIEAARLGQAGAGFQVIATEMRRLTDEIDRANKRISEMAEGLISVLPKVAAHAEGMRTNAESMNQEFAISAAQVSGATAQLRTTVANVLSSGDQGSQQILAGSHSALSHLSFQDPVAQSLLIVDADLHALEVYLERLIEDAGVAETPLPAAADLSLDAMVAHRELNAGQVIALGDGQPAAQVGDILLF